MSLRTKVVASLVVLSALAAIAIGLSTYHGTVDQIRDEIERSLDAAIDVLLPPRGDDALPDDAAGDQSATRRPRFRPRSFEQIVVQVINAEGAPVYFPSGVLPVTEADVAVAGADARRLERRGTATVDGERFRVATVSIGDGRGAIQVARSLAEQERVQAAQRRRTVVATVLVTAVAALIGWFVARQITRRLVRLTAAAEEVADTGRLDVPIDAGGPDEAGRLGVAFSGMLAALARSRDDQQRLVQDAGHELRTPLTSLRTNISVLRRFDDLPAATRQQVLDDLDIEARELTALVDELVQLATEQRTDEAPVEASLGPLVRRVAERAARRSGREIVVDADSSRSVVRPQALERAVGNLIENAVKFDEQPGGRIDVVVRNGRIEVSDRGPGIDDADLPHVFDRFYRAVGARSRPGSGLGLSIVNDVATMHGGTAFATNRPGGGATVGISLPTIS